MFNIRLGGEMVDYLVRFVSTLDPNGDTGIPWPKYTPNEPNLLTFNDDVKNPLSVTQDNFRLEAMDHLTTISMEHPI